MGDQIQVGDFVVIDPNSKKVLDWRKSQFTHNVNPCLNSKKYDVAEFGELRKRDLRNIDEKARKLAKKWNGNENGIKVSRIEAGKITLYVPLMVPRQEFSLPIVYLIKKG